MLIRLNRLNDVCVEFRMSNPVPPAVDGGTTVIGNEVGSLIILSMESGSSTMPDRFFWCASRFSSQRKRTSSLGVFGTCFLVNSEKDFKSLDCLCKTISGFFLSCFAKWVNGVFFSSNRKMKRNYFCWCWHCTGFAYIRNGTIFVRICELQRF